MVQQTIDFKENVLDKQSNNQSNFSETESISDFSEEETKQELANNELDTESNELDQLDDESTSYKDSLPNSSPLGPIQRPNKCNISVDILYHSLTTEYIKILNDLFSPNLSCQEINRQQHPPGFPCHIQSVKSAGFLCGPNIPVSITKQPLQKAKSSPWNSVLLNDFDSLKAPTFSLTNLSSGNHIERLWATGEKQISD